MLVVTRNTNMQSSENFVSFLDEFKSMYRNVGIYSKRIFQYFNSVMTTVARDYTRPKWILPAGSEPLSQHVYETKSNEYEVMIFRRRLSLVDTIVKCTS